MSALTPFPARPTPEQLARLCRSIRSSLPELAAADQPTGDAISAAAAAFVAERGEPERAAAEVAELFEIVGVRSARCGEDAEALARMFQDAHVTLQRSLLTAIGTGELTRDQVIGVRERLFVFLGHLARRAHEGHQSATEMLALPAEERLARLRRAAFGGGRPADLDRLASAIGRDPHERVTVIVSTRDPLPGDLLERSEVLAGPGGVDALVPERWDPASVADLLSSQAVAGPPGPLREATSAIALSRRAADLLGSGHVQDGRLLVPYSDLLADLVVQGNPLLSDLIIDKHLRPLESLSASRRIKLAEVLLHALERGLPINQLARDLGIPRQTVHSRMRVLRTLLGDTLDDPAQRLELIVALRAALPRWRSGSSD